MMSEPRDHANFYKIETESGVLVYLHQGLVGKKKEMVLSVSGFWRFYSIFEVTEKP